jgi:hypothetical protein
MSLFEEDLEDGLAGVLEDEDMGELEDGRCRGCGCTNLAACAAV